MTRNYVRPTRPDEHFARLLEVSSPAAAAADESMGSLTLVANALRAAGRGTGPAAPDPAFRAALRQRLVAVATVQATSPAAGRSGSRLAFGYRTQRRIAALAGTFAIATSVAGVGVAAARSLPGNPFYDVKRATEAVQLWTARGDVAKGKRHLEFARTRLAEAKSLSAGSSHLASTLAAMNTQTTQGAHELIAAYNSSRSLAPLADLLTFSNQQVADLTRLAPTLPPALRAQETKSIQLLTGVVQQVHAVSHNACVLCGTKRGQLPGGPTPPPVISSVSPTPHPEQSTPGGATSPPTTGKSTSPATHPTSILPTVPTRLPTHLPTNIPTTKLSLPPILHHSKHPHPLKSPLPILSSLLPGL